MNILNLPAWSVLDTREADHDYHITVQLSYPPRREAAHNPPPSLVAAPIIGAASSLPRGWLCGALAWLRACAGATARGICRGRAERRRVWASSLRYILRYTE